MNGGPAWQSAKARNKAQVNNPRPVDPRIAATNNANHASVGPNSTALPLNPNVRPNAPSDGNHQNSGTKPDISNTAPEAPHPPFREGRSPSDGEGEPQNSSDTLRSDSNAPNPPPVECFQQVTTIQRQALSSLLKGISIPDTAELCGVDEWTLRGWLQIPEVNKLYRIAWQQNVDFVNTLLQEAARKAAATLVRLSESDNPSIQTRASKAIVQLSKSTNAATQKAQVEAEVAKARQEDLAVELQQVKTALSANAKNWEKIRTSLVHGTFRRPGWLPRESWERIISARYDVSVAW